MLLLLALSAVAETPEDTCQAIWQAEVDVRIADDPSVTAPCDDWDPSFYEASESVCSFYCGADQISAPL